MKRVGMFWDEIEKGFVCPDSERFKSIGLNTGNMVFIRSLKSILGMEILPRWTMGNSPEAMRAFDAAQFDAFVTTDLIWITPNAEYPHVWSALKRIGDRPLIPISVGVQNSSRDRDFSLAPDTARLLQAISERAIIGVRGEYTAEVLNRSGVKRLSVIGCPSVFYGLGEQRVIRYPANVKDVTCNFRTFYGRLSPEECHFLTYAANRRWAFVEQTMHDLKPEHVCHNMPQYQYFSKWLNERKYLFFYPDDWSEWIRRFDFSIGSRFHGNVIALINGVPALTMAVDSRMSEMCELFHIPVMSMKEFDDTKPVSYYYEKADPSDFVKHYPKRLEIFKEFLKVNHLI